MDIRPVPAPERNLRGIDFFLLWAGVAISLAEIWAGGFLAPLGFWSGLWAILLGHLIGNTLMGSEAPTSRRCSTSCSSSAGPPSC
jgi:NCS1 family nucleobase:cation symporter-1